MKSCALLTAALGTMAVLCAALPGMQNSLNCDPHKQYENRGRCCTKCPPGTHLKTKCTPFANTTCSPCGPNEYMSVWNEDVKCTHYRVCDSGKALHETFKGNSTYPRECECTEGYYFDVKQDFCMENDKCLPGFGVRLPVQSNKNTVCTPCPVGYYSNSSSAIDACIHWTNCTYVGLHEIVPGTNISDAICDRRIVSPDLTKVVIPIIVMIVVSGIMICIIYSVCYKKKWSTLIAQVQNWVQKSCDQDHGSQKKVIFKEQIKDDSRDCLRSSPEERNLLKESLAHQGRMIPTEVEYLEEGRSPETEHGSMVAGLDSTLDLEIGSLGTFPSLSDTSSDRLLPPSQEEGGSIPLYSHYHCGQSAKEIQDNCARDPVNNVCSHCASQHTFQAFSMATYPTPERNDGEEPCSCFTDRQYSRSGSSASSSPTTEVPPTPSGNVTGNQNTTVISTAPVMHIKTDIVVVYYNSSSQDTHAETEDEDSMRRPTQEESPSHFDSFVINTQPPRYTDIPCSSMPDTDSKISPDQLRSPDIQDLFCQEEPNIFSSPNTNFVPVQEEGKPEYYI
ncbi:tumor necrosis factor receptor superfamily member 11A isoform X2 [Phyllobates terribilis]|uniref:tumor necrosis factor receptor superfamily member 11A isoform X2 n=1 Tax=Phyllobates terribilis TaxID=111132 RepID=UPI003CCB6E36